jgi:hypothetical protein
MILNNETTRMKAVESEGMFSGQSTISLMRCTHDVCKTEDDVMGMPL